MPLLDRWEGGSSKNIYTVLGDTVNMALRLESATPSLTTDIAISEDTFATLKPEHQEVLLKSYDTSHRVYHSSLAQFDRLHL